ncbi:MAG: hypothetical protein WC082_00665 [Victivallales bacterium]
MSEEITIECPECKMQFLVPVEYCGGVVDCTECGTLFEILALPEDIERRRRANSGKQNKKKEDSTNTVAISRSDIGMIPDLKNAQIK